ncbi:uncharacterized protein LAJ45_01276 [Morchella importuna]|uniref:uncharacterized protein n=1 Tax=Morchella importuna TaxID=1174673 RepID=UPI001E8E8482|nr:uncharacterized protein LAJ45_01276 [Morchella importuna]KAH8154745.1 hypothetical protein LAJ45_01276 [Morchella importuna]
MYVWSFLHSSKRVWAIFLRNLQTSDNEISTTNSLNPDPTPPHQDSAKIDTAAHCKLVRPNRRVVQWNKTRHADPVLRYPPRSSCLIPTDQAMTT